MEKHFTSNNAENIIKIKINRISVGSEVPATVVMKVLYLLGYNDVQFVQSEPMLWRNM
jgi:hypothetical protein